MKTNHTLLFWLAMRFSKTPRQYFTSSSFLSLVGLVLGVASLFVSMAVFSGFEATLRKNIIDVAGEVQVKKKSKASDPWLELEEKVKKIDSRVQTSMRFTYIHSIAAANGSINGVVLQGVDPERVHQVLNLKDHLIKGEVKFGKEENSIYAMVGKGLAQKLRLDVGGNFKVVTPIQDDLNPNSFKRRVGNFKVIGILDLGKHDYDERFIVTDLESSQSIAAIDEGYNGLILKLNHADYAREISFKITEELGHPYWATDWQDLSGNLFEAVKVERIVIFFVVLIIVIVAAFNISSSLFVSVVQRYADISILKALGLDEKSISKLFSYQGLIMGIFGVVFGILIGGLFCAVFLWAQNRFGIIPGSVYKVDKIILDIRFWDVTAIAVVTLIICFIATLAPAKRGAKLNPVEGLRYE